MFDPDTCQSSRPLAHLGWGMRSSDCVLLCVLCWSQAAVTVDPGVSRRYVLEEAALQHDVLDTFARLMLESSHATDTGQ